jgi:hypothetical protein
MDIFRKDDGSTIIEGRRKIYSTVTPMKLLLPDGSDDGVLDKGDLIYVAEKIDKGGKDLFRFMVLKFAETDKQKKTYFGDSQFFNRYYDENSNVVGEEVVKEEKKPNYIVPAITGIGLGTASYLLAKKYQKNAVLIGACGLIVGLVLGHYIANKGFNKEEVKK